LDPRTKRVTFSRDVAIKEGFFYSDNDNDSIPKELASNDSNIEYIEPKDDSTYKEIADSAINESIPQQFLDELIESASALNVNVINDPITYNEALKSPYSDKWKQAIEKELNDLKAQNTWTLTKLPTSRKALKTR
jgi:hypothetical protein